VTSHGWTVWLPLHRVLLLSSSPVAVRFTELVCTAEAHSFPLLFRIPSENTPPSIHSTVCPWIFGSFPFRDYYKQYGYKHSYTYVCIIWYLLLLSFFHAWVWTQGFALEPRPHVFISYGYFPRNGFMVIGCLPLTLPSSVSNQYISCTYEFQELHIPQILNIDGLLYIFTLADFSHKFPAINLHTQYSMSCSFLVYSMQIKRKHFKIFTIWSINLMSAGSNTNWGLYFLNCNFYTSIIIYFNLYACYQNFVN
jgi:hypothetical protein